jgi:hypothetical protein
VYTSAYVEKTRGFHRCGLKIARDLTDNQPVSPGIFPDAMALVVREGAVESGRC